MFEFITSLLALDRDSIPPNIDIDDFIDRLQRVLVTDPYSAEVNRLRQFALRNEDPGFAEAFRAKIKLFEQQQRQLRPAGSLSNGMYRIEKALGYILNSKRYLASSLIALTCVTVGGMMFLAGSNDMTEAGSVDDDILDPFAIKIDEPDSRSDEKPIDDWVQQQVLQILRTGDVQRELRQMLGRCAEADRISEEHTLQNNVEYIQRQVEVVLSRMNLSSEDERAAKRILESGRFANELAVQLGEDTPAISHRGIDIVQEVNLDVVGSDE